MKISNQEELSPTEPSEGLIVEAEELIDIAYSQWNDFNELKNVALRIVDFQIQLSRKIADSEVAREKSFLIEYESQYGKGNVSIARAKSQTGTSIRLKYEFDALKGLLRLIETRLKHLQFIENSSRFSPKKKSQ